MRPCPYAGTTRPVLALCAAMAAFACHTSSPVGGPTPSSGGPTPSPGATLARIYYWRAKPGKLEEYGRYIREGAEPIDHEAQRRGAFVSIETIAVKDTAAPATHIRVFLLRDSAQLAGLARALDEAGIALHPDSAERRARSTYSATLRDPAGQVTMDVQNGRLPYLPLPGFGASPVREGWIAGARGVRLYYRLVGEGRDTIVFVHGGPGTGMRDGYDFERLVPLGHALLMYDQRGAGMSELVADSARLGIQDHAGDLQAVVTHFRLGRAKVIGLSWGAAVVATWAGQHPDAVDRIAFVSPMSPTRHLGDAGFARVGGPSAVAPRGDTGDYPQPVLRNRIVARAAGLASLGADHDLRPTLARIQAPALVTDGERANVPLDATRAFAAALPHARLTLVPDAGRQAWLDRPDLFFPLLDGFMRAP